MIAPLGGQRLQRPQQGAANSLKPRIGRYVIKANRSRIGHRSDRKNFLIFHGHEH